VAPPGFAHVFFTNSGSEANDTNLRLVKRYYDLLGKPQKKHIISRRNAYHGSTIAAASLGGMKAMHEQANGLDYVHHINQPHWFELRAPARIPMPSAGASPQNSRPRSTNWARTVSPPSSPSPCRAPAASSSRRTATGQSCSASASERDILLIADEVICGFGRTGEWWGSQTYDHASQTSLPSPRP
jgi:putrescine aminotransferase